MFDFAQPRVLVRYSPADRRLIEENDPAALPRSLLLESRAQRMGCHPSDLRLMWPWELERELADEVAVLGMGPVERTCRIPVLRLDEATIDAVAQRFAAERAADWAKFLAARADAGAVPAAPRPRQRSRVGAA